MKSKITILAIAFLMASILLSSCSTGNKVEHNARVTTNDDCSEVYTWEELDSNVLGDTKQMISYKLEEKGIDMDGSIIDALIELKKRLK